MKVCSACKKALEDRAFYRNSCNGRLRPCCIACEKIRKQEYRDASRQQVKAWDAPAAISDLNAIQTKWSHK